MTDAASPPPAAPELAAPEPVAPASRSVPRHAVSAEVVLLTLDERALRVALVPRREPPARGEPSLPSAYVAADEDLDRAARRALREQVGLDAPVRQFHAFGGVDRDPRRRVIGIAYTALLPLAAVRPVVGERVRLFEVRGGVVHGDDGEAQVLPLDQAGIVTAALGDLAAHLDTTSWAFGLLPEEFTLRDLQRVHEAIRGRALNKPAFRKRLLDSGKLVATGRREGGMQFRPAELYRLSEEHGRER